MNIVTTHDKEKDVFYNYVNSDYIFACCFQTSTNPEMYHLGLNISLLNYDKLEVVVECLS